MHSRWHISIFPTSPLPISGEVGQFALVVIQQLQLGRGQLLLTFLGFWEEFENVPCVSLKWIICEKSIGGGLVVTVHPIGSILNCYSRHLQGKLTANKSTWIVDPIFPCDLTGNAIQGPPKNIHHIASTISPSFRPWCLAGLLQLQEGLNRWLDLLSCELLQTWPFSWAGLSKVDKSWFERIHLTCHFNALLNLVFKFLGFVN